MPFFPSDIDELLAKVIAGEAEPAEQSRLDTWLEESAENRRYYEGLQKMWRHARPANAAAPDFDTEKALEKVKSLRRNTGARPSLNIYWWPAAAAAALVLLLAAYWLFLRPAPIPALELAATDAIVTDTLPDRSVVVLDKASSLRVAENFDRKERRMQLSGAAHFAVQPDKEKPFVVEVAALEVRVVGTEFTVDTHREPGSTVVTVNSGIVQLTAGAQQILVHAGEQAQYRQADGSLQLLAKPDPNVAAWHSRVFKFEATPLSEVVKAIEQAYDIQIVLKNSDLARCTLTTDYANESPERILELIAETFSLQLSKAGEQYVLDGPACVE